MKKSSKRIIPAFLLKRDNFLIIPPKSILLILSILQILVSCGGKGTPSLMPEISTADSMAILYYTTPGNPRFYTFSKSTDTVQMRMISNNVNQSAKPMKTDCATAGKMFFYKGTEEAYTVYFSNDEDCSRLYFIRTGEKYYVPLKEEVKKILEEWKKGAKEPAPEN